MKTKKRKIGKKIPQKKGVEEKLFVVWESPKQIPDLPYGNCEELEEFDWSSEIWTSICRIHFRVSGVEDDIWYSTGTIEDLVYENALLQNVEFEWGTFSRPVQITPTICGKDIAPPVIKTAEVIKVNVENTKEIESVIYGKSRILHKSYIVREVVIMECQVEKNFIYKNTKFFCRTCGFEICNECFISECSAHDVQWLGIATFQCFSPEHKENPKNL